MLYNLTEYLKRFLELSSEEVIAFASIFEPIQVKKRQHIIKEGDIVTKIYFINEGVFRSYCIKDGEEYTTGFFFGPSIFTDTCSVRDCVKTKLNVQALKDADVFQADFKEFEELMDEYPKLMKIYFSHYERMFIAGMQRQQSFIFDTPEERYLKLIEQNPEVILEIPQQYIATYLGITPETLSRIRKRIVL